jgi:hypothetical protein
MLTLWSLGMNGMHLHFPVCRCLLLCFIDAPFSHHCVLSILLHTCKPWHVSPWSHHFWHVATCSSFLLILNTNKHHDAFLLTSCTLDSLKDKSVTFLLYKCGSTSCIGLYDWRGASRDVSICVTGGCRLLFWLYEKLQSHCSKRHCVLYWKL